MVNDEQAKQRAIEKRARKAHKRLGAQFHNRSLTDANPTNADVVDCVASDTTDTGETQAVVSHVQAQPD
jgi:hypothetical protein